MPAGDTIRRDGVIYRDNGDGTATVIGYDEPQGQVFNDPSANTRTLTDQAQLERTLAENQRLQMEADKARQEQQDLAERRGRGTLQSAMATGDVLTAIREVRRIAARGGTGAESLAAAIPATDARALRSALEPVLANLSFDRLQQMRDQSETGGALGSITERELSMLGASVASLDPGVDLPTFLQRLDRVERHFMGVQMAMNGINPNSPEGQQAFRDFGYGGTFGDGATGDRLADRNASQSAEYVPDQMSNIISQYVRDNWGNIDPADYVRLRTALDAEFGYGSDVQGYSDWVQRANERAAQGIGPDQAGATGRLRAPDNQMGTIEQGLNWSAQSTPGAFAANWANAATGGLPSALSGNQQGLDLVREAHPTASTLGEFGGSMIGSYGIGRAAPFLGLNPMATDVGFNALYGATQDPQNAFRGAVMGGMGAAGGSMAGRAIGGAFPTTYARGAVAEADAAVPTPQDLRALASQQYRDVEARGIAATGQDTTDLASAFDNMLQREGRITPQGNLIDTDTPITRARQLVQDYSGSPMTPTQAQRVRSVIAEGAGSPDPTQRRLGSMMTGEFDQWASPVLPGIDVPRRTAQRYLQGEQIGDVLDTATARGTRQKGNDVGDAIRTAFGRLDENVINGIDRFDPAVVEQIARTARGDPLTNAMRQMGKFGLQNPLTMATGGGAVGLAGNAVGGPAVGVAAGIGTGLLGSAARATAGNRTARNAEVARLMALGGDEYRASLDAAIAQARRNAGSIYGGLFGTGMSINSRQ